MLRALIAVLRVSIPCPQCGESFDPYTYTCCPNCGNGVYHHR